MNVAQHILEYFLQLKKRLGRHRRVLTALAAVTVFLTVYALTLPAITLDQDTADEQGGIALPQTQIEAEVGSYHVTASYGEDAQLPGGARLAVSRIKTDSDEYRQARDAVMAAKKDAGDELAEDELGMVALDIHIEDAEGTEVEPQGEVNLKVEATDLPEAAADKTLEVQHIVEPQGSAREKDPVAQTVAKNIWAEGEKATAEFDVDSFSTFAITWRNADKERVANVTVHYVDAQGNELLAPSGLTSADFAQASGDRVDMERLATDGGKSRIAGYVYSEARLSSFADNATVVSALKTAESDGQTVLQYAEDGDDSGSWTALRGNHAEVYLMFEKLLTVHYVDADGTEFDAQTDDLSDEENGTPLDVENGFGGTVEDGYLPFLNANKSRQPYSKMFLQQAGSAVSAGGHTGVDMRYLKYKYERGSDASGVGTGSVSYSLDGANWTDLGADASIDVYLVYVKVPAQTLTVHHVDADGNSLEGVDDGTRTITATTTLTPGGFAAYGYTATGAWFGDASKENGTAFNALTYTLNVSGDATPTMTWSGSYQDTSGTTQTLTELPAEVWVTYEKGSKAEQPSSFRTTFHHVDEQGSRLTADTQSPEITNAQGGGYYNRWNGYSGVANQSWAKASGIGTFTRGYFGTFGQNELPSGGGLFYKWDPTLGMWHTGTGTGSRMPSGGGFSSVSRELYANNDGSTPVLYTEVWMVYTGQKSITIHHVDANGNLIAPDTFTHAASGGTITPDAASKVSGTEVPSGYVLAEGRINTADGSSFTTGTYYSNGSTWTSTFSNGDTQLGDAGPVSDIYLVYASGLTFTLHYVDQGGNPIGNPTTKSFTLPDGSTATKEFASSELAPNIANYTYTGSYLGSTLGQAAKSITVEVDPDDPNLETRVKARYLLESDLDDEPMTTLRRNVWSKWTASGRTFTLRKGLQDYTLIDSQLGNASNELSLSKTVKNGDTTTQTYVASAQDDNATVHYTVEAETTTDAQGNDSTVYRLRVEESTQSGLTDIYQVYASDATAGTLWIENDMIYSGRLVTGADSALKADLNGASGIKYTWYKRTKAKGADDWTSGENGAAVERKELGSSWSMPFDESDRTWIDVVADGGALNESDQAAVEYKCVVSYTTSAGEAKTATSGWEPIDYYSSLANGSFESPTAKNYSNADYKAAGGVWQTTGIGEGSHKGEDIEIVKDQGTTLETSYSWYRGNGSDGKGAYDGSQFAELNAANPGALYQDVVTVSNESLNYWLAHRARGGQGGKAANAPEYDTMYLVIMPTKLAMTSGDNGGELDEQEELQNFLNAHGGYSSDLATSEEDAITYYNESSGILVQRISSSDQRWHRVNVPNGYVAKSSLTRFFFVAGSTAADHDRNATYNLSAPPTMGNFIDDVGFSQELPAPEDSQFQMAVTKTFTGLELSDIQKMATNRLADGSEGVNPNPVKLTIHAYQSSDKETRADNAKLDGAVLSFRIGASNEFVLEAKDSGGNSLLGGSNSARATVDDRTGDVTMTWTFLNIELINGVAQEYYVMTEEGDAPSGWAVSASQTTTVAGKDASAAAKKTSGDPTKEDAPATEVKGGDTVRIGNTNTYRHIAQDGLPLMRVSKTFSGLTSQTVQGMLANSTAPYKMVIGKTGSTESLTLTGNAAKPYEGALPAGVSNVQLAAPVVGADGATTLTWTIMGTNDSSNNWVASGNYSVREENYAASEDAGELSGITVNRGAVDVDLTNGGTWPEMNPSASVGNASSSKLVFNDVREVTNYTSDQVAGGSTTSTKSYSLPAENNFIVMRYTTNNGSVPSYLVWSDASLGLDDRAAVYAQIGKIWSDVEATSNNTGFLSGDSVAGNHGAGSMALRYDNSGHLLLDLTATAGNTWAGMYSSAFSGEGTSELSVANQYKPVVKLRKVARGDEGTRLAGARFTLSRVVDEAAQVVGSGYTTEGSAGEVGLGLLEPGTYVLEETDAPDGYDKLAKPIRFAVAPDGTVSLTSGDGADNSVARVDSGGESYALVVGDAPGYVLPRTGGPGDAPWALVGAALVAAAALGWLGARYRRQRRRPRHAR